MTAPVPAPEPMTLDRLAVLTWNNITAVLEAGHEDELRRIHAAFMADASEYAMHMVELYARPDDRWEPK